MPVLSDEQRPAAFVAAAGIVVGMIALLALVGGRGTRDRPDAIVRAARIVGAVARTATSGPSNESPRALQPMPAPEADAARFFDAYLQYEVGDLRADARAQLLQSATPSLGQRLLGHTVELPPGEHPPVGQIQSLHLVGGPASGPTTVRATIEQEGWTTELVVHLDRVGDKWLVGSLS